MQPVRLVIRVVHMGTGASEFDQLFAQEWRDLVGYAYVQTGDPELAVDLAQHAFVKAFSHWDRLQRRTELGPWLRRVVSNASVDVYRSAEAARRAHSRLGAGDSYLQTFEPEGEIWPRLLEVLPPRQKEIAVLRFGIDRSVEQIASELGISTGTVKSTLAHIRRAAEHIYREVEA